MHFLFTDLYALASAAPLGSGGVSLLGAQTLQHALWWSPAMLAGIWVGHRGLKQMSEARFCARVLKLLIAIAALGVLRALWALIWLVAPTRDVPMDRPAQSAPAVRRLVRDDGLLQPPAWTDGCCWAAGRWSRPDPLESLDW